jgi:nucleotide-binding universal stress UspA family protein
MLPIKKILCPTDFSEPSYEAIKAASELASHFGAEMILLHVVPPAPVSPEVMVAPPATVPVSGQDMEALAKQSLEEMVGRVRSQGLRARYLVLRGEAADEIVRAAEREEVELAAIATRGRTGLDRLFFGSVAEKVVRLAKCPVLTVAGQVPGMAGKEEMSKEEGEGEGPGEKSEEKKFEEERIEAQLKDWGASLDEMKSRVEKAKAEIVRKYEEETEKLRVRQEAMRLEMMELRNLGQETWGDFKQDMEKSLVSLKGDLDRTISRLRGERAGSEERAAGRRREAYRRRAEAQLKEWGAGIDALKAKAEMSTAGVKNAYLKQIEELRKKQETARRKLQELKESGDLAWKDLKSGADQVFADLKRSLKQAARRFKEK